MANRVQNNLREFRKSTENNDICLRGLFSPRTVMALLCFTVLCLLRVPVLCLRSL